MGVDVFKFHSFFLYGHIIPDLGPWTPDLGVMNFIVMEEGFIDIMHCFIPT